MTAEASGTGLDLFVLEDGDGDYYLYAPLEHAAAVVNAAAVVAVRRYLRDGQSHLTPEELAVIDRLREGGLIPAQPATPPLAPSDYLFQPCEVTLFPTTRCNLRCVYCYAEGGDTCHDLHWSAAKAAIDVVAQNASLAGRDNFVLGFHGGGEPTLNWDLMERSVNYAHETAAASGLKAYIHAASNGLLSQRRREFIAERFSGVNLSLDGPRDIHDAQRVRPDGTGSFDEIMESVRYFEDVKFPYGVRATITEAGALRMKEIVSFFRQACPSIDQLHVEPVWLCGRCRVSGVKPPEQAEFVESFMEAWEEGNRIGLSLFYSGARLDAITDKFCAAPGDGFSVTSEGLVTSCFEVNSPQDPRSGLFHYGRYDDRLARYVFDFDKIARLRRLTVDNIPNCQDCF